MPEAAEPETPSPAPEPAIVPEGEHEPRDEVRRVVVGRTGVALLTMAGLLAIPYASGRFRSLRVARAPWDPDIEEVAETTDEGPEPVNASGTSPPPPASFQVGEQKLEATDNEATVTNALPSRSGEDEEAREAEDEERKRGLATDIEDPTGHALDRFYADLARTVRKEPHAVTRILHYGDSIVAGDIISGSLRRSLQDTFGDAGHGFILMANPWAWYFHNDVAHGSSADWLANRLTGPWPPDKLFGLGGVSFNTETASAWFGTASKGEYGLKVSRFDLYYLAQPHGGDVWLTLDNGAPRKLSTLAPEKASRVESIEVPDGAHTLNVKGVGSGPTRLFGVALERDVPGVVYDALGVHAAKAQYWRVQDEPHWRDQLALRRPSLLVFQFGTNESQEPKLTQAQFAAAYEAFVAEVLRVKGDTPMLVVSCPDRATKGPTGDLRTSPIIEEIITTERETALAHGVAFWNTFHAMGGRGTMARWRHTKPPLANGDLSHPTVAGGEVIAQRLHEAILRGYAAYASTHADAPSLPAPAPR